MLDNLAINIEKCHISGFIKKEKVWDVICTWTDESEDNKYYQIGCGTNRAAIVAIITEDGKDYHFTDRFDEVITKDNDNSWVIDTIEARMRKISEDYREKIMFPKRDLSVYRRNGYKYTHVAICFDKFGRLDWYEVGYKRTLENNRHNRCAHAEILTFRQAVAEYPEYFTM